MIPRGPLSRFLIVSIILVLSVGPGLGGCSGLRGARRTIRCESLDSLLAGAGFERGLRLMGRATIDANEQRLQGKIILQATPDGDVTFEFTSTVLFGAHREDFVFSLVRDTLRVIDRERGIYHEGEAAEEFLQTSLEMEFELTNALHLTLGGRPACARLEWVEMRLGSDGGVSVRGKTEGESFRLVFAAGNGRLTEAVWPVRLGEGTNDRLKVRYRWSGPSEDPRLDEVVMQLEDRQWRCRLRASN
ncbi:MAG: hypothetical protein O7D32_00315 [bacterium]|nr:hypothetical protein [bacterium]